MSRPFDKSKSQWISMSKILPSVLGKEKSWSLSGISPETIVLDSSFRLRVSSYLVVSVNSDSFLKLGPTNLSC